MSTDTTTAAAPAAGAAATTDADKGGLLDTVAAVADGPKPGEDAASKTEVSHLAEDPTKAAQAAAAAKRERPAYVPEKFWNKEKNEPNVEGLAKSYAELEKNFKLGKHKPPADGKYGMDVFAGKVPEDDPLAKAYVGWAQKHGLSQAAFDELGQQVIEMAGSAQNEGQISRKDEMAKLGPNGPALMNSMVDWARGLVSAGVWSTEDFEEFKFMGGTAAGLRALQRVRESYEGRIPLQETTPANEVGMSDEELHAMVGHADYLTNKGGYRDKVEKLFEKRYGVKVAQVA